MKSNPEKRTNQRFSAANPKPSGLSGILTYIPMKLRPYVLPLLAASPAFALPAQGTVRPALSLVDVEDQAVELRGVNGKPMVVVLENRESAEQNTSFKSDLATLNKSKEAREGYVLIPIADVEGYDYWPARGFVKDAIREQNKKLGRPIWVDWRGQARRTFGASKDKSVILIFGKDGKLKFAAEGTLGTAQRAQAMTALKCELTPCGEKSEGP